MRLDSHRKLKINDAFDLLIPSEIWVDEGRPVLEILTFRSKLPFGWRNPAGRLQHECLGRERRELWKRITE